MSWSNPLPFLNPNLGRVTKEYKKKKTKVQPFEISFSCILRTLFFYIFKCNTKTSKEQTCWWKGFFLYKIFSHIKFITKKVFQVLKYIHIIKFIHFQTIWGTFGIVGMVDFLLGVGSTTHSFLRSVIHTNSFSELICRMTWIPMRHPHRPFYPSCG